MPVTSKAQFRAMQASAHGNGKTGIPKSIAEEYLSHAVDYKSLPEHVKGAKGKKRKNGKSRKRPHGHR